MRKIGIFTLIALMIVIAFSSPTDSYEVKEKDGDGFIEVGEKITFIGDDYIVESDGDIHYFNQWAWDFNGDFIIDAYGKVVTHTYKDEGYYRAFLYEIGDVGYGFTIEIDVVISNDDNGPGNAKAHGWYRNDGPGDGEHNGITGK